jgi:hypothetical protein
LNQPCRTNCITILVLTVGSYNLSLPGGQPPSDATPVNGEIWRGIKKPPLSSHDFLSEAEKKNPKADLSDPEWWGLSVWTSKEQADQGRGLFRYMEKWHIACGTPSITDCGVIKATPREQNPFHYTWWKTVEYDATPDFQIVLAPLRQP